MPDEWTVGLIGLVTGAVSGFVTALITNQFQRRREIDESVRDIRKRVYSPLWNATSVLPMWPRASVSSERLNALSEWLRDWYFGGMSPLMADDSGEDDSRHPGGMYLSQEARAAYTGVQEAIKTVVQRHSRDVADSEATDRDIADEEYDSVRLACSRLRTELTEDLLSRKRAFLIG